MTEARDTGDSSPANPSSQNAPARPDSPPGVGRSSLEQITGETFSALKSVGGWRGILEAVVPTSIFLVGYVSSSNILYSGLGAIASGVVFLGLRLWQRSSPLSAIGGIFGMAIGLVYAVFSGHGENYFAPSLWTNAVYLAAILLSLALRWPLVGVAVGNLRGQGSRWRKDPQLHGDYRAYTAVTWLWAAMFAIRLAVKVPLYWMGEVAWLGTFQILLGFPLFALTFYFSWLLLRRN